MFDIDGAEYDREIVFPIEICIHHLTIDCQSSTTDDCGTCSQIFYYSGCSPNRLAKRSGNLTLRSKLTVILVTVQFNLELGIVIIITYPFSREKEEEKNWINVHIN